jgi:hypothetical protein
LPLSYGLPALESTGGDGKNDLMQSVRRHDLGRHQRCPRCGANFNRFAVVPVGLAIMLAIAFLYVLFQRFSGWMN